jgi:hypothetical protein
MAAGACSPTSSSSISGFVIVSSCRVAALGITAQALKANGFNLGNVELHLNALCGVSLAYRTKPEPHTVELRNPPSQR